MSTVMTQTHSQLVPSNSGGLDAGPKLELPRFAWIEIVLVRLRLA
ncbi:MAG: hypothetical protein ABIP19_12655 [Dermatophilaceae bacterium]